ncbi:tyrosine-type recombinase/integrase [bacterium]|nr:tyrosine-type recombinase/integrase [bacterium]
MAKIYRREIVDPTTGQKKPGNTWWISYMENGKQQRRSLKVTSKKLAELERSKVETNIERGQTGLPKRNVDLNKVYDEFHSGVIERTSPSWSRRIKELIRLFMQFLNKNGLTNMARITTADIERYLTARSNDISPKTWNEELRIINRFFRFAVARNYIVDNPAAPISKRHVEKPAVEILKPHELELIMKYANEAARPLYQILLYTGMREGEARHLQWQDVDLTPKHEHVIVRSTPVHRTKNRKDRIIPLSPEIVEVFKILWKNRDKKSPYVLPNSEGKPRFYPLNTWMRLLRRIERDEGVLIAKGFHMNGFHLFRHTFATNALASGVDIRTVQDWLGHSSIVQTQRYLNLLPEHKHQQIKKLKIAIGSKK